MFSYDTIDELQVLVYKLEKENELLKSKLAKIRKEVEGSLENSYIPDCEWIIDLIDRKDGKEN